MIKRLPPIDIRPGDMIYTGYTGKKAWRRVYRVECKSAYRFSIYTAGGWAISAGSACYFLVKSNRKPHGF